MKLSLLPLIALQVGVVNACTNILCSSGASKGGNVIAYNADAPNFYTSIYHYPAGTNPNGTMRKLWTWDYGTYTGEIPEAEVTYNVVGNVNEHGLIITESTFGGLMELTCTRNVGLVDYGSLIYLTLQRSRNVQEAISMMDFLVNTYGYASTGESFSLADQNEMWYLELIGKGRYEKGAVWVARRVPDGYISGHANQARITTFPLDDTENCRYSADVVSFAQSIGLYPKDSPAEDFSFSDIYDPVTFEGARFCEARVWSVFSRIMGEEWSNTYLDYAQGYNLTNRMPLFIKPPNKQSVEEIMDHMRNHYEGTALDTTGHLFSDVGAGAFSDPNRNSPIEWTASEYPGKTFFNERTIAQGPTGWSIVCQSRPDVPPPMAAILWFGIDDSSTSVHFPVYGSATRIPEGWAGKGPQDGVTPPMMQFSLDSAFYVFNLVANWAYSRWDAIYPDVYQKIIEKESEYFEMVNKADAKALELFGDDQNDNAIEYLTSFSFDIGTSLLKEWFAFFGQLFVKYRDGYVTVAAPDVPVCGCSTSSVKYQDEWYNRIVDDTGDLYEVPVDALDKSNKNERETYLHDHPAISKLKLRAMQ